MFTRRMLVLSVTIVMLFFYLVIQVGLIHCSYKKFVTVVVILLQNNQKETAFLKMKTEFSGDFLSLQLMKRSCFLEEATVKPALAANRF